MKVKSNIKPQNKQNLLRIGGVLPLPHTRLHLKAVETSEDAHSSRNLVLVLFYKSKVIGNQPSAGRGYVLGLGKCLDTA